MTRLYLNIRSSGAFSDMDLPPNPVCQMLHCFMIEALASRPELSSLALDIEALRHPELESTIMTFKSLFNRTEGTHVISPALSERARARRALRLMTGI
jgi:hypothetical protein